MANTTDLAIICYDEPDVIEFINKETGLDFLHISDDAKCGGQKITCHEMYSTCPRCIGNERIEKLITTFLNAPFDLPEFASLIICDDNTENYNGVYRLENPDYTKIINMSNGKVVGLVKGQI